MKKLEIKEGQKSVYVTPLEDSYTYQGVGEIDTLVLSFEVPNHIELNVGAEVVVEGVRYTLMRPQDLTMYHTQHYSYRATFYGDGERTRLYKVQNQVDGRLEFTLTAKPHEHLQMLVDIMNARDKEGGWKVGSVPERAEVMIPYNHTTVLGGLQQLADKLETEWSIDEKTLHIGKLDGGTEEPLALRYGEGNGIRPEVKRLASDEYPVRRVYVQTGERNIDPAKYGGKRLHLPKSVSTAEYYTDAKGTYVELYGTGGYYRDESVDLKHVHPMREGVVSSVVVTEKGQVDFADSSIPDNLDYSQYQIPDEVMKVVFQSGMLAGRDGFEVHKYLHTSRTFQLVQREEDGITMPSGSFLPKVGDKYAVFGCALPDEYIRKAEEKLLEEALKVLHEERDDKFEIRAEIDGIWASKKWGEVAHKLKVGKSVLFSDPEWLPEPTKIRIVGVKRYLSRPYSPEVELANSVSSGSFSSLVRKVEGEQVIRREETRQSLIKLQDRTYKDTEAVREMVEKLKVEGFSKTLKPETLQTMYAVIGSPALQFEFVGGGFSWTEGKGGAVTIPRQTIRQRVAGTTLEPNPKTVETTIPALTYTLKPDEQQAHIYVELKPTPRYVVSTKPLQITPGRLLVGLLNGGEGSRDFTPLYGFTEISPSHIATRYIRSRSGNMLIDLETGNIYSDKIEFRRPDGSKKSIEEVITDTVQVGGRNLALRTQQPRRLSAGYAHYILSEYLTKDTDYTIQFDVEVLTPPEDTRFMVYFAYSTHLFTRVYIPFESGKTHYSATLKTPNKAGAIVDDLKSVYIYPHGWGNRASTVADVAFSNVKLERGTVATDWSPAPEDVQASIENEAKAREAGDKALSDSTQTLQHALDALRESGANDNATLTDLINKANQRLDNLQEQADGEVSNWFYPGAPAPNKAPENEWTTNGLKARHIGDTYTSTDESGQFMGKSWRYTTEFKWQEIHDTLVSQALAQASKAQTTADGKSTTFLVKPTKYEEGDTWVMESSQVVNGISYEAGTMLFANQGSSAFIESHWVDKVRYIGATQLKESEVASKRAWEAYANAQAEAERVKAEAHADGIVTAEEQARINATNKALETAKAYAEAQDKLLETRQKAYADGVLTEAERRAVNVAEKEAKLAETNAKAYSDGVLTEAEKKAIAQAQKAYDDAVAKAKELDGQIQVGGRNLIRNRDIKSTIANQINVEYEQVQPEEGRNTYTLSFEYWIDESDTATSRRVSLSGAGLWFERVIADSKWHREEYTVQLTTDESRYPLKGFLTDYSSPGNRKPGMAKVRNVKLERGTVATDWSPAPEDVQAEIQAVERGYQKLIERVDVEFAISNSRNTAPTSGWVTNAPTPARGQALWQRTKVYLKDGTAEVRGVTCIQGKDGLDGKDGAKGGDGVDGRGITKIVELYYLSSSNTALGNGAWSETAPTPKEGFWIWTKTRIHYTTGEQVETQPICVTGNKGDRGERGLQGLQGKDGTNGLPGRDGVDGKTSYTHIAYADTATGGGFSQSPTGKAYIGMYVDFVQTDSSDPKKYAWSLIKGADGKNGLNGKDGVPGKPGVDGRTPYLHIAYANSQDGKQGFSVSVSEGKSYIGTYTDYTQADSTDPTKYSWSRIKGDKGDKGEAGKDVDPTLLKEIQTGLSSATSMIDTLNKAQEGLKNGLLDKTDTKDIQYLLDSLKRGSMTWSGGLFLLNDIILSDPNSKDVTAMISGSQTEGAKAMRLGITYTCDADKKTTVSGANDKWGVNLYAEVQAIEDPDDSKRIAKINELGFAIVGGRNLDWTRWEVCKRADLSEAGEATAFNNSGTGHIGELFFNGDYIGFGTEQQRYMTIGGVARTEQEMNEASTTITEFEIPSGYVDDRNSSVVLERWESAEGNRQLIFKVPITASCRCELIPSERQDGGSTNPSAPSQGGDTVYESNSVSVSVWAELEMRRGGRLIKTYKTTEVKASASVQGGSFPEGGPAFMSRHDSKSATQTITVPPEEVQKGDEWTLLLKCYGSGRRYAYYNGRTSGGTSLIPYDNSKPLISITDSKAAFFYGRQKQVLLNYASEVLKVIGNAIFQGNLAIKGTVTADAVDTPGIPLCGAMVNKSGGIEKSFGRYKNKSGTSYPQVSYSYSTKSFTVYHSIAHNKYIPLVNPFNDPASPVISDVREYSFNVRFTLQSERYDGWPVDFSYIAFKAE